MACNICGYVFYMSLWFYSDVDMRRKYLKKIATISLEKIESACICNPINFIIFALRI